MEHTPENFASVHMLYVNCSVNGNQMKAFVDSGAQVSIISKEFAELCHIAHLIDTRFQGMAIGVGTQNIVGKIHACQMSIGGAFFTVSFNVLEANNMQVSSPLFDFHIVHYTTSLSYRRFCWVWI